MHNFANRAPELTTETKESPKTGTEHCTQNTERLKDQNEIGFSSNKSGLYFLIYRCSFSLREHTKRCLCERCKRTNKQTMRPKRENGNFTQDQLYIYLSHSKVFLAPLRH